MFRHLYGLILDVLNRPGQADVFFRARLLHQQRMRLRWRRKTGTKQKNGDFPLNESPKKVKQMVSFGNQNFVLHLYIKDWTSFLTGLEYILSK